ncbi:thioredoxin family protein [Candidatus Saccharibacteria bacterium]|nr:thioredoxin family protein [Candidatus Saccharibacteria bacterium]
MKRTIVAWMGIIIATALVGTGYVYWQNSMEADAQNVKADQKTKSVQATDAITPSDETAQQAEKQPGVYKDYQEGLVASTDGVTVLFFHAPWCPQCRMIDSDIKDQGVPNGVTVLKVDYDSNQALRQKYGITLQTTFVEIDDEGNEIEKYVAYNEPSFDSVKRNLLDK